MVELCDMLLASYHRGIAPYALTAYIFHGMPSTGVEACTKGNASVQAAPDSDEASDRENRPPPKGGAPPPLPPRSAKGDLPVLQDIRPERAAALGVEIDVNDALEHDGVEQPLQRLRLVRAKCLFLGKTEVGYKCCLQRGDRIMVAGRDHILCLQAGSREQDDFEVYCDDC